NGIVTARDALSIAPTKLALWERVEDFATGEPEAMRRRFGLGRDVQDWSVSAAQRDLLDNLDQTKVVPIAYRPFDTLWTFFTGRSRGFLCRPRTDVMRNYVQRENLGFLVSKAHKDAEFAHAFVTRTISEAIFLSG